jgi:hypothetical protein
MQTATLPKRFGIERAAGQLGEHPELNSTEQRFRSPEAQAGLHDGVKRWGVWHG